MSAKALIFVVDDQHTIADTLAMVLKHAGFNAVALYSGPDAVDLCHREPCDVLLSDVMMDPMNGIETALAIREICPTCKVLLFSGNPDTARLLNDAHAKGYSFQISESPSTRQLLFSEYPPC